MKQTGYVTFASDTEIKVRIDRASACGGNCAGCHGCPSDAVIITAKNDANPPYQVGEEVKSTQKNSRFFAGTFGSYGLLTACILIGIVVGYYIAGQDIYAVFGGLVGFGLGALLMKLLFRRHQSDFLIER